MDANEKLVRDSWSAVGYSIFSEEVMLQLGNDKTFIQGWAAAAEYTRERLEQIRQVEREIEVLIPFANGRTVEALRALPDWAMSMVPDLIRQGIAINRAIAREQAHLDALRQGMRPRADEGDATTETAQPRPPGA